MCNKETQREVRRMLRYIAQSEAKFMTVFYTHGGHFAAGDPVMESYRCSTQWTINRLRKVAPLDKWHVPLITTKS